MKYYAIDNEAILIADNQTALSQYYDYVQELPEDYVEGKYIIGEKEIEIDVPDVDDEGNPIFIEVEEEITVIDYDEEGNETGSHKETITKKVPQTHKETITIPYLVINPNYEEEQAIKERERLDALTLTPSDVERALYKAKSMDFEDLKALIAEQAPDIDMKALAIEFRANNFYRGVVVNGMRLIDTVGALLGYTPEDMDYLFINKELPAPKKRKGK